LAEREKTALETPKRQPGVVSSVAPTATMPAVSPSAEGSFFFKKAVEQSDPAEKDVNEVEARKRRAAAKPVDSMSIEDHQAAQRAWFGEECRAESKMPNSTPVPVDRIARSVFRVYEREDADNTTIWATAFKVHNRIFTIGHACVERNGVYGCWVQAAAGQKCQWCRVLFWGPDYKGDNVAVCDCPPALNSFKSVTIRVDETYEGEGFVYGRINGSDELGVSVGSIRSPAFIHYCSTEGGSSGAPLATQQGVVIGVHCFGSAFCNEAAPITQDVLDFLLGGVKAAAPSTATVQPPVSQIKSSGTLSSPPTSAESSHVPRASGVGAKSALKRSGKKSRNSATRVRSTSAKVRLTEPPKECAAGSPPVAAKPASAPKTN